MALDKVLHKIQEQINDLAPMLEVFVDDTIQPSVSDCETLQKQLVQLQEQLAVYKHNKLNKEISPSFNIHAKISAQDKQEEKVMPPPPALEKRIVVEEKPKPEPVVEIKQEPVKPVQPVEVVEPLETRTSEPQRTAEPEKQRPPLAIGLNDKFRFIRSLFLDNASEYGIAIEQLGNLTSWHDAELYLASLRNLYDWKENDETAKQFYGIVKKRFD